MTFIKFSFFIVFFVKSKSSTMIVYIRVLAYKLVSACMLLRLGGQYTTLLYISIYF